MKIKLDDKYTKHTRPLTTSERELLKSKLEKAGKILQPILIDENGVPLDGWHRLTIARELGWDTQNFDVCPYSVETGLSEEEKVDLAKELNFARRQMAKDEFENYVHEEKAKGRSDRSIAKDLNVSKDKVARAKAATVSNEPVAAVNTGQDGRVRPNTELAAQRRDQVDVLLQKDSSRSNQSIADEVGCSRNTVASRRKALGMSPTGTVRKPEIQPRTKTATIHPEQKQVDFDPMLERLKAIAVEVDEIRLSTDDMVVADKGEAVRFFNGFADLLTKKVPARLSPK